MTFNILMVICSVLHHLQNNPMKDKNGSISRPIKRDSKMDDLTLFVGYLTGYQTFGNFIGN